MTSFSHLFVHVRDLEKTREFYAGLLGLTVLMEHPGYLRLGGGEGFHLGFEERDEPEIGAAGVEIVIRVDDVDAAYHRLTSAGVPFQTAPEDQEWGARHAWLTDPDGYRLSLFSDVTDA
jgi:catechol 2,3-dioxygenase-like lactoylglutathione lyase family enzyme